VAPPSLEQQARERVGQCQDAVPVDLAAQAADDDAVVATASDACMLALQILDRLHGSAATSASTFKDQLMTFVTALEYTKVTLKYDQYDEDSQSALFTSVLEFHVAADKYLDG
jgi:hypothetical protein